MRTITLICTIVIFVLLSSCRKDDYEPVPSFKTIEFKGNFEKAPGDPLSADDITIVSVVDEAEISTDGTFTLNSLENQKYQIFIANSDISGNTAYFGISEPETGEVLINDSTTALGLLLINPYLMGSEQEQRRQYLEQASAEARFPHLIESIKNARQVDPGDPLNFDQHPEIYQLVNEIMMASMEKLAEEDTEPKYGDKLIEIIDGTGNNVGFDNYRHIFYAADIYHPAKNTTKTILLSRKEKVAGWRWRWPPWKSGPYWVKAPRTDCNIEDGYFNLDFYGFNVGTFADDTYNAKDQATLLNTVYMLVYSLDMFVGIKGMFKENTKLAGLHTLLQAEPSFINLQYAICNGDESGEVMSSVISLLISDVGFTILSDYLSINIKKGFLGAAAKNLNVALKVIDGLGYLNEHIPFFADLIRGPLHKSYKYFSSNGILSVIENNLPPEAKINISPSVGFGETLVNFSVDYTDDYTNKNDALFSWKWVEDGSPDNDIWSTPSNNPDTVLTLSSPGKMFLKTDDLMEGEHLISRSLPFYDAVDKIRIVVLAVQKLYDYQYYLTDSLGYSEEGPDLYYVLTYPGQSCDLPGQKFNPAILNPMTDLLVVDPSASDYFCPGQENGNPVIEAYLENQVAITNFVRKGGNLLFITDFLTGYETTFLPLELEASSSSRVIRDPSSNRNFINGNEIYISTYEAFSRIPDNSMVHLINDYGAPLIAEIKKGEGIILNSVFKTFYFNLPGEPNHWPVNINTFRYMTGATLK